MTCIIIDDDEMSREHLMMLCEKIDGLLVQQVFDNGIDAINWLKVNDIDFVLLDIQMPNLSGMDLVKNVEDLPQIVFTTGHTEYALEAFEHHVTDFVPKPIQYTRLLKAVERVRELNENVKNEDKNEIFVRVDGKYVRLHLDDVLFIESLGDYVKFITAAKTYIVHSTLKNIDGKIQSNNFLKVHRSYIVNLNKIVDIDESNLVINDKVIPVSRAHRANLMNRIRTI
jgi:two-component system LytT family response regulator